MPHPLLNEHPLVSEELAADIAGASEGIYAQIAETRDKDPATVHKAGVCHEAAKLLVAAMVKSHDIQRHTGRSPWVIEGHSYGLLNPGKPEELVVDQTWQQFVRGKVQETEPRVLVGTRDEVIAKATSLGVDPSVAQVWSAEHSEAA